jgi:hypothetical protein
VNTDLIVFLQRGASRSKTPDSQASSGLVDESKIPGIGRKYPHYSVQLILEAQEMRR